MKGQTGTGRKELQCQYGTSQDLDVQFCNRPLIRTESLHLLRRHTSKRARYHYTSTPPLPKTDNREPPLVVRCRSLTPPLYPPTYSLFPAFSLSRQTILASPTSSPTSRSTSLVRPGPTSGSRSLLPPVARDSVLSLFLSCTPAALLRSSTLLLSHARAGDQKKAYDAVTPTTQ